MSQLRQMQESLYESYTKTAANIITYFHGAERTDILNELREVLQQTCEANAKLKAAEDIKDRLFEVYVNTEDAYTENISKEYEEAINEIRPDASQNEDLLEYDRQVADLLSFEPSTAPRESDDTDEDLQLTETQINVIDPFSKKRMVDPVKNIKCGHTYDRESVISLLKINKKTRCPVVGCGNQEFISVKDLKSNIVIKTFLERNPV